MESRFGMIEGVLRTRVGYAGGHKQHPTYGNMGDHTETVQVDYDPKRISYRDLLDHFWASHRPTSRSWSRQYRNAVFYHDKGQHETALASKAALEGKTGETVKTAIVPLRRFTMAEEYHQKYMLKNQPLLQGEMARIYPDQRPYVDSTAVARLNGYAGGYGSREQLLREIDTLGLSDAGRQRLNEMVP